MKNNDGFYFSEEFGFNPDVKKTKKPKRPDDVEKILKNPPKKGDKNGKKENNKK
jgi:hypothetical protein